MRTRWCSIMAVVLVAGLWAVPRPAEAYYDPGIQRWINRDPIIDAASSGRLAGRGASDEYQGLYAFAGNQPLNVVDAYGLWCLSINVACQGPAFTMVVQTLYSVGPTCPPIGGPSLIPISPSTWCYFFVLPGFWKCIVVPVFF